MTKKEKDLKVLEAFNLKIGDSVKISPDTPTHIFKGDVFVITERADGVIVLCQKIADTVSDNVAFNVGFLLDESWTKLKSSLKDKKCKDITCYDCPFGDFRLFDCDYDSDLKEKTIGEIYNSVKQDLDKVKKEIFGDEK